MSIDIGQFAQVFLEEAAEHLASMESGLLGLDLQAADPETLNAIFRAAHSIKGGAGTFGLDAVAEFTHTLETLLDRIRHGKRRFDEACLDACLRSVDLLRDMLDVHTSGGSYDAEAAETLVGDLQSLLSAESSAARSANQTGAVEADPAPEPMHCFDMRISLPAGQAGKRESVESLLMSLAELGTLDMLESPLPAAGSPCWHARFTTVMEQSALSDFAEFVLEPDWIRIVPAGADSPVSDDNADPGYGFFEPAMPSVDDALSSSVQSTDDGFGFFDDAPGTPQSVVSTTEGDGYGFFEPIPSTPASPDAVPALQTQVSGVAADEAYGFFEPLDAPAGAPAAPVAASDKAPVAEDPGYGFFDTRMVECDTPEAARIRLTDATDGSYGFFDPVLAPQAFAAPKPAASGPVASAPQKPLSQPAPKPASKAAPASGAGAAAADTSIRVPTHKIDQLINLVGELVITQSMLKAAAEALDPVLHEQLLAGLAQLERNSRDLQESVLSTRMVPMSVVFSRYPRIVRDIAKKLGKQVDLQLIGESVELDKGMVEKIVDPLTHLVRNAVDHGLEMPEARLAKGKKQTGTIMLIAEHQSGQIVIEIVDDGAGLNRERILEKAHSQGIPVEHAMPDSEVWDLIFAPGFSTAETVTEVSGRGVGMDVVRKNIVALGGSVHLSSESGLGTRVTIRLPLTLAILDGMTVRANSDDFIIPLGLVVESLPTDNLTFKSVGRSGLLVKIREDYVPMASLAGLLGMADDAQTKIAPVVVVLEFEGRRMAIGVDALLGQQQVVVKNLESNYRRVQGISGATILGNGQVALILDVSGLASLIQSSHHS